MKMAVFSDVHANLEALEAVIEAIQSEKVDRLLCLGDLVGYGPDPDTCVEMVLDVADTTLCGNHDQAAIGELDIKDFNPDAREAILWTQKQIQTKTKESIRNLITVFLEEEIMAVHASPAAPQKWEYMLSGADFKRNLDILPVRICFVGHSHVPGIYIRSNSGEIMEEKSGEVRFEQGEKYIINVGSVGQPRGGDSRSCYGLFDTSKKRFELKRVSYPILPVQKKMAERGLPQTLIDRLAMGF